MLLTHMQIFFCPISHSYIITIIRTEMIMEVMVVRKLVSDIHKSEGGRKNTIMSHMYTYKA